MTHQELVQGACRWLKGNRKCNPVFADFKHMYSDEIPDAIGWTRTLTHVVECKVSKGDFRKDAKKKHHKWNLSIGQRRWYLVPRGLLTVDDIPEDHGLLYASPVSSRRAGSGMRVTIVRVAPPRVISTVGAREEIDILRQAVIRHVKGVQWLGKSFAFESIAAAALREAAGE